MPLSQGEEGSRSLRCGRRLGEGPQTWQVGEPGNPRCDMMGVRNPEWRKPVTKSGGCRGRGLAFPDNSQAGVDGMPKFRWVTPVSPPSPANSRRRPPLLSSWSSPSWPPCSWPWAWYFWCRSFGRSGRRRAPTGPAARSRWVPELHRLPTSSYRLRSGSSECWGWPQLPPLLRTARRSAACSSCHRHTSL